MATSKSMQGKFCLITGATSGMGKETALGLARLGATVVLVGRDRLKGEETLREMKRQSDNENIDLLLADLSSQQEVRKLAADFKAKYSQLHVLVNNAGAVFSKRQTTVDGLEMTFALDHLAYFLLTNLVLDTLKASAPSRIINISSQAQGTGKINFDDLQGEKSYGLLGFTAYSQAKLANVMFTYDLARRLQGTGVTVNAVGPGPVSTNFGISNGGVFARLTALAMRGAKTPEDAARTAIRLASASELEGETGKFYYNEREIRSSRLSHNVATQKRLWDVSEELTKAPVTV
jgi:NAD(P)-dependent dehydrogenase (short-subunit alcohol dehydrogenase family)